MKEPIRSRRLAGALAIALAALVAVATPVGHAAAAGYDVNDILVPVWDAASIDGQPIVIPDDAIAEDQDRHPSMSFARHGNDTWASGEGACNGWGAVVDVSFDGSFAVRADGLASTDMGCGDPRESIDRAFARAFLRAIAWEVRSDGTLALLDADGEAALSFVEAPTPSLPGDYYLTRVQDPEEAGVDFGPADMPVRVTITDDTITTTVGCNALGGGYHQDGHQLRMMGNITPVTWCEGLMDLEASVRAALLSATAVHAGRSGALTLLDTYGFPRAALARTDDRDLFGYQEHGDDALHGTSWAVRMLRDPALLDEESLPGRRDIEGEDLIVSFGTDARVTGSTGCGAFAGTYRTERSWISIDAHALQPCEDPERAWTEAILLDALAKAGSFELDEWLSLRAGPGGTILLSAEPRH